MTFAAVLVGSFIAAGCTVKKDFGFSLDKSFDVVGYPTANYSHADTVDAGKASADFTKYKADISSFEIQSGTYTITSFNGPMTQNITSGSITVGTLSGGTQKLLATLSNVNLSSIKGIAQPLDLTPDGKTFLQEQMMGSTSSGIVTFNIMTNETPITFSVLMHFDVKATYSKTLP